MYNPEKQVTQDKERQTKNTTTYVLETTIGNRQTSINDVNKTISLLQTTGGR